MGDRDGQRAVRPGRTDAENRLGVGLRLRRSHGFLARLFVAASAVSRAQRRDLFVAAGDSGPSCPPVRAKVTCTPGLTVVVTDSSNSRRPSRWIRMSATERHAWPMYCVNSAEPLLAGSGRTSIRIDNSGRMSWRTTGLPCSSSDAVIARLKMSYVSRESPQMSSSRPAAKRFGPGKAVSPCSRKWGYVMTFQFRGVRMWASWKTGQHRTRSCGRRTRHWLPRP